MCALSINDTVVTNPHMFVSYQAMKQYSRHELWTYAALVNYSRGKSLMRLASARKVLCVVFAFLVTLLSSDGRMTTLANACVCVCVCGCVLLVVFAFLVTLLSIVTCLSSYSTIK